MSTISQRSWIEDSHFDNGNYENRCCHCGELFVGHKRRVTCKACTVPDTPSLKSEDITQERISRMIFVCPLESLPAIVAVNKLEALIKITDGEARSVQLKIQCQACGKTHLADTF